MLSRARVAACFASAALIGPTVAPAAHADVNQCAPITIDDQQVACVALSAMPVTEPNGDPGVLVTLTVTVAGESPITKSESATVPVSDVVSTVGSAVSHYCVANGEQVYPYYQDSNSFKEAHEFGIGTTDPNYPGWCFGLVGLTLTDFQPSATPPSVSVGSVQPASEPYHVPKVCITTSPSACIGPYDGVLSPSIPMPGVTPPTVSGDNSGICLAGPPGAANPYTPFVLYGSEGNNTGNYDDTRCFGN